MRPNLTAVLPLRSDAAELEIMLHEVQTRSKICMRQLRSSACDEQAKLLAKVDAVSRELVKLEGLDVTLRQTLAEALKSRRELEAHIEGHTVPKADWRAARQEIATLQVEVEEKTVERLKLYGAIQVV